MGKVTVKRYTSSFSVTCANTKCHKKSMIFIVDASYKKGGVYVCCYDHAIEKLETLKPSLVGKVQCWKALDELQGKE